MLNDRLSQAINQAERHNHFGAVMFIDLDRFKNINDSLGHHAGDDVLKESAERMEFCRREEDTVARMGGDEFVWVLPELAESAEKAAKAAYRAADRLQPQASCKSNRMISCEALVRWNDPELGSISPAKFIPIAEETGLILDIGSFVLDRVCRQIHHWDRTPGGPQLDRIAVNISPLQFRQHEFVERVKNHLERWQVSPERLELELTEGLLIEQIDVAIEKMRELRQLGVRFAIDDFGTGYSSLAYLNKLPLDILKINQSFIRNMFDDNSSKAIVTSIITMAKLLGFELVAEGVETEEQLNYLRDQGCETYQGYLFGKPVPAHELATKGTELSSTAIA